MFNHLIATTLICLGVANTTPISNYNKKESNLVITTPKKQNITQDYQLTLNPQSTGSAAYNTQVPSSNTYYPTSSQRTTETWNLSNNNNYINILGNIYKQSAYVDVITDNNTTAKANLVENYNVISQNFNWNNRIRTEMTYVFQLTPYNYNYETRARIDIKINITEWENQNGTEWYTYENYLIRNIYRSTENNWQNYINMQKAECMAYDIARDIENVNNGFFYTKDQTLIQVGTNTEDDYYNDRLDIEITPNTTNYMVIEYIPVVRPVETGGGQATETMIPLLGAILNPRGIIVNGTNVIPDGTYEIVDIPGLMFEILGMPFAFVSQAFNLTLFPGTPYQINIANLFLSIIAIFVFVWLIMIFIKMKSGG